jgi:hypothetical protein
MKAIFILLLLIITSTSWSQKSVDFSHIDWKVLSIEAAAPDTLARWLTSPYKTELEKTRAIFRWIAENISYKAKGPHKGPFKPLKYLNDDADDTSTILKSLDLRVAELVLIRKLAVCDGYARLFKTLCDYAGIKSEVVSGFARSGFERGIDKFKTNHRWNAVMIDSVWHVLDVTWASGHSTYNSDDFTQRFNGYYFLTPPKDFIKDHYPEDIHWSLISEAPIPREFNAAPLKYQTFQKFKIHSYSPQKGIIEAAVGDTLSFEMKGSDATKNILVLDSLPNDSLYQDIQFPFTQPVYKAEALRTQYIVVNESPQWLYMIYNDVVIMRYRLKIKKSDP